MRNQQSQIISPTSSSWECRECKLKHAKTSRPMPIMPMPCSATVHEAVGQNDGAMTILGIWLRSSQEVHGETAPLRCHMLVAPSTPIVHWGCWIHQFQTHPKITWFKSDYIQLHPRIHRYMHINKDPCCTLTIGRFMWQTQSRPFRSHYHPSQIGVYPILSQTWGLFIIVFTLLILDS